MRLAAFTTRREDSMFRFRVLAAILTAALFAVSTAPLHAQGRGANGNGEYPAKPVRMIVPLAPGGGSDIVGRILAQALMQHWGQSVVVDNRPGAGSTIGTAIAARASPDGYSLLVTSSSFTIGSTLYPNLWYDAVRDFDEISLLASQPSVIAVNPGVPAKSLRELVALMQAEPGKLGFGSAGQGTASHLANELFLMSAGAKATHVPYKSAGLAATALLGGEIQFMVTNLATAVPLVRAGRLRGLAVTSARRAPSVAELPTAAEAGLPGYEYTTWYGILAPAGTPLKILTQIHGDVVGLLQSQPVAERFNAQGLDVQASTPTEFEAYVKSELDKWSRVIRTAGLRVQ
jgi:tripartite-type tricarboxylate transporter receptor subunit TctC